MSERQVHPVAALFPMLADDELEELAADIGQRGQLQPIILDSDGRILDGRNRLAACRIAGVDPVFETYDGGDPDGYALSVNIARRHLSTGARAIIAAKASKLPGMTQRKIKADTNLYQPRVAEAGVVLEWAPDLADAIVAGAHPLSRALEVARERKADAEAIKAKMERLRADAADLAALVDEERMALDDAMAALEARVEKARRDAEERRRKAEAARSERQRQLEAEKAEEARRRQVATSLLCQHVVTIAQTLDTDTADYYDPELVLPGRAVTRRVIDDAIRALTAMRQSWEERELP